MSKNPKTIFLIAGEDSGDTLGAELINSIRNQPDGKDIELIGEIDLLVKDEQEIYYVLDWKSGLPPRTPLGRSQLGIYGFLTHSVHNVPYSNIRCAFVSLKEGSCVIREFREQRDLKLLKKRLNPVIETLSSYDTGQNQDYEWAVPTEQNCIGCPYSNNCEFSYI